MVRGRGECGVVGVGGEYGRWRGVGGQEGG